MDLELCGSREESDFQIGQQFLTGGVLNSESLRIHVADGLPFLMSGSPLELRSWRSCGRLRFCPQFSGEAVAEVLEDWVGLLVKAESRRGRSRADEGPKDLKDLEVLKAFRDLKALVPFRSSHSK